MYTLMLKRFARFDSWRLAVCTRRRVATMSIDIECDVLQRAMLLRDARAHDSCTSTHIEVTFGTCRSKQALLAACAVEWLLQQS